MVRNSGVLMPTIIGTVITRNKHCSHIWKLWAIMSSIVLISLLKRFIIRPMGVVSKKDMGECAMFRKMPACNWRPARTFPMYSASEAPTMNIPVRNHFGLHSSSYMSTSKLICWQTQQQYFLHATALFCFSSKEQKH